MKVEKQTILVNERKVWMYTNSLVLQSPLAQLLRCIFSRSTNPLCPLPDIMLLLDLGGLLDECVCVCVRVVVCVTVCVFLGQRNG